MQASPFDPILPRLEPLAPLAGPGNVEAAAHKAHSFAETLAKLEVQARDLKERSVNLERPSELGDALSRARDSLEGVLALRERLLASAREAQNLPQEPPPA